MEGTRRAVPPVIRVRHGLGATERPIAVVHIEGEHDIESRPLLVEALDPLEGHVIIDLASCTFLDTSVIGAILGKAHALGKHGYRLEVVVPPGSDFLNRAVARLGLRDLVPIVDGPPRMYPTA